MRQAITHDSPRVQTIAAKLLAYCRAEDWAGYDPYDALNSRWLRMLPLLDARVPRLALTQFLKRFPVNTRRLLLIPKRQNPKALGLFLAALLKLERAGVPGAGEAVEPVLQRIRALRSAGTGHWCWGYSFPWQTRTIIVPAGAPNLVCTVFVAEALLDYYEQKHAPQALEMAASAAEFIRSLYWTEAGKVAFAYPQPSVHTPVYNANFLAAALLCRAAKHTGDASLVAPALAAARYSAAAQMADGSWYYGEGDKQRWIDNFHTGYNLTGLHRVGRFAGTAEFEDRVRRGYRFYLDHFFRADGAARYFHDRTFPIDAHCVAQSLITLTELAHLDSESESVRDRVLDWAVGNLWSEKGPFYYRRLRRATIRTSYMRWTQAWMLLALATVLSASAGQEPDTHAPSAEGVVRIASSASR